MQINVTTLELDDRAQGGTSCKFYRVYEGAMFGAMQWGSSKSGRSGGSNKIVRNNGSGTREARLKLQEKVAGGYVVVDQGTFEFELVNLSADDKVAMSQLENAYGKVAVAAQAATRAKAPSAPDGPEAVINLAKLLEDVQKSLSVAATDPIKALTLYSGLTERVEEAEAGVRKIKSYMSTLEIMFEESI